MRIFFYLHNGNELISDNFFFSSLTIDCSFFSSISRLEKKTHYNISQNTHQQQQQQLYTTCAPCDQIIILLCDTMPYIRCTLDIRPRWRRRRRRQYFYGIVFTNAKKTVRGLGAPPAPVGSLYSFVCIIFFLRTLKQKVQKDLLYDTSTWNAKKKKKIHNGHDDQ